MRTLSYFLVVIFVLRIFTTGFINKPKQINEFVIQSGKSISKSQFIESAKLINKRLGSLNCGKFSVEIIPNTNKIKILFDDKWNKNIVKKLVLQKGDFGFYKVYNRKEITKLIGNENKLFLLLSPYNTNDSIKIGCVTSDSLALVNDFLKSFNSKINCKFVWDDFSDNITNNRCLYALRAENGYKPLLQTSDIVRFDITNMSNSDSKCINCNFSKRAAKKWADITRSNINKPIAIVMDNSLLYLPLVRSEIKGGKCQISGDFSLLQLQCIKAIVNNGSLASMFVLVND